MTREIGSDLIRTWTTDDGTTDELRSIHSIGRRYAERVPCRCCGVKSGRSPLRITERGRRRLAALRAAKEWRDVARFSIPRLAGRIPR